MQNETQRPESKMCRGTRLLSHLQRPGPHRPGAVFMEEKFDQVGPRERQIIDLLLQGCDNSEIARDLNIAERTVKAHFNRLFLRFGIKGGIKRVKLATMLYRRQLWSEKQLPPEVPAKENMPSSNLSPKAARTGKLQIPSAPPNTLSRTTSA